MDIQAFAQQRAGERNAKLPWLQALRMWASQQYDAPTVDAIMRNAFAYSMKKAGVPGFGGITPPGNYPRTAYPPVALDEDAVEPDNIGDHQK